MSSRSSWTSLVRLLPLYPGRVPPGAWIGIVVPTSRRAAFPIQKFVGRGVVVSKIVMPARPGSRLIAGKGPRRKKGRMRAGDCEFDRHHHPAGSELECSDTRRRGAARACDPPFAYVRILADVDHQRDFRFSSAGGANARRDQRDRTRRRKHTVRCCRSIDGG